MKYLYYSILVLAFVAIWFFYGFLYILFDAPSHSILLLYVIVSMATFRYVKTLLRRKFFKNK